MLIMSTIVFSESVFSSRFVMVAWFYRLQCFYDKYIDYIWKIKCCLFNNIYLEDGDLNRGSESPPHQLWGLGECRKLPQQGPGGASENPKFDVTWDLKSHYRNAL